MTFWEDDENLFSRILFHLLNQGVPQHHLLVHLKLYVFLIIIFNFSTATDIVNYSKYCIQVVFLSIIRTSGESKEWELGLPIQIIFIGANATLGHF